MANTDDTDELLDTNQVAELFKVSPRTVAGWRNAGVGPRFIHLRGRVRYKRGAVNDYVAQCERETANH